jgi:hypothetical protein
MITHDATQPTADRRASGRSGNFLHSWFIKQVRGRSLPIVATLVVMLLGLPDELVDILRELPCATAGTDCCEALTARCDAPKAANPADVSQLNLVTDPLRDMVTDWFFRIWTLFF